MSSKMWVLEYGAQSIGQATDLARQATPVGRAVPDVSESGRLGYEVASSDYDLIDRLRSLLAGRGEQTFMSAR